MAEARGRPRPGQLHPEAEQDDPDGVQGGDRDDTDPEFEKEDALPGGNQEVCDAAAQGEPDPEYRYKPLWAVQSDEMHEVVHRFAEAQHQARRCQETAKKEL